MPNTYFQFQEFKVYQKQSGMKVTTDACLFGAWVASQLNYREPNRILDIGTGTGLLSLMVAQMTQAARIDAIEINQKAINEASVNFSSSPWKKRLRVTKIAIQEFTADTSYDVIICNPPFFNNSLTGKNDDKNQAIHSNDLPMEDLIEALTGLMGTDTHLYLLYPEKEMADFKKLVAPEGIYCTHSTAVRHLVNRPVFRMMNKFERSRIPEISEEIILKKTNHQYTDEAWKLLKGYYLPYNDPNFTGKKTLV